MIEQPVIETARLRLRPLEQSDSSAIQKAAADRRIADTMISIPHPYPADEAERYLTQKQAERKAGRSAAFAMEHKSKRRFCGLIELRQIDREHSLGELSFWVAVDDWGQGFMSEAVQAVVRYGFETLGLNRLYAYHMQRNPATGRILAKSGFRQEGLLRQRVRKWGKYEDVALWAVLRQDWQHDNASESA